MSFPRPQVRFTDNRRTFRNVDSPICSCLISACTTGLSSTGDDFTREEDHSNRHSDQDGSAKEGGDRSSRSIIRAGSDTSGRDAIEGNGAHAYEDVGADAGAAADDDAHEDDDADVGAWPESDGTLGTSAPVAVGTGQMNCSYQRSDCSGSNIARLRSAIFTGWARTVPHGSNR